MTRFWHRRICEATIFVSLVVITLYMLPYVLSAGIVSELIVSWTAVVLSAFTLVLAFISYLWTPKNNLSLLTFAVYALLVATTANLVLSTGQTSSPFIAMWIAVAVFAGVFGIRGFVLLLGSTAAYIGYSYYQGASNESLIVAAIAGMVPLVASFIIWHSKSSKDTEHEKAYSQLASELSHEANKSETVIGAINDGVISVDKQGVIQLINPAAQRMLGWGQKDAMGLSYKSVVKLNDPSDKPVQPTNDPIEQVLSTNQEVHSEDFSITTEAGKKVLLSIIVSPIGRPSTGAIMVLRDMTKEKSEEREQAEFISTASHEMRTPVASIEGYLGLALNPATAQIDEKARDYIQKAQSSAQHLGRLFQDLLDVSRADDGRLSNNPAVIDVVEYAGEISEGLRIKAQEKGLRFMYKPRPDGQDDYNRVVAPVYYVHVDADHLREVVANLIENAIKYTLQGDVIIDVSGNDTHVVISVQDSGIGIPNEDIPHLFQKFYRVDNSDTREIGGTGLGLYLCRRLTEVMGGQIRVESTYKKGSTFFLELPRIDHMEAERLMEVAMTLQDAPISPSKLENVSVLPAEPMQPSPLPAPSVVPPPQAPAPSVAVAPPANVPLTQIEQNPSTYVTSRSPLRVPVRGPEE